MTWGKVFRYTSGTSSASSLSAIETHLWERQALGRMLKARLKCLLPLEDRARREATRTEGRPWPYRELATRHGLERDCGAWHSLGEGVERYSFIVLG